MQNNKNIVLIIVILLFCTKVTALEKIGIHCNKINSDYDIKFFFNHGKAFYLDTHYVDGEKVINDQFAYFKDSNKLGEQFLIKNNFLYWGKNPFNNFFTYKLDLKSFFLTQKFILKKKDLNKLNAILFNKSEYYVEVNEFKCKIIKEWSDIERLFNYN